MRTCSHAPREHGCDVRAGMTVEALSREGEGWTARLSDGTAQSARNVFLATGKHDLRGWNRPPGRQRRSGRIQTALAIEPRSNHRRCAASWTCFFLMAAMAGLPSLKRTRPIFASSSAARGLRTLGGWNELLDRLREDNAPHRAAPRGSRISLGAPPGDFVHSLWLSAKGECECMARGRSGRSHPLVHRRRHGHRFAFGCARGGHVSCRQKRRQNINTGCTLS